MLAKGSDARLIVIVPKIVHYAVALNQSPDSTEFVVRRYSDVVAGLGGEGQILPCLCRRLNDVITQLLPPQATVVVGGRAHGLLPSQETKLVRRLTALGHHVVFVPTPQESTSNRAHVVREAV